MSSNPFERTLWIDILVSKRLLSLILTLYVTALCSLCLSDISLWLKLIGSVILCVFGLIQLKTYGLGLILTGSALVPGDAIVGLTQRHAVWQLHFADNRSVPARLKGPIWRWRYLLLLRFEILSSAYPRSISLLLTPWQVNRESFSLLYSRLGWAEFAHSDD